MEVFESKDYECNGVMRGLKNPFKNPATPHVVTFTNGSIAVSCDRLIRETGFCGAAVSLNKRGLESRCAYLFPVLDSGIKETTDVPSLTLPEHQPINTYSTLRECYTRFGKLVINLAPPRIFCSPLREGGHEPIPISATENTILQMLMESQGTVVPRNLILLSIYDTADFNSSNASVYMRRVRIALNDNNLKLIRSVRGIGYIIDNPE